MNTTNLFSTSSNETHQYTAEGISIILGAMGALIASLFYALKNIKHSTCCLGFIECEQQIEENEENEQEPVIYIRERDITEV